MFNNMYRGVVKKHGEKGHCKVFVPAVMPQSFEDKPDNIPWCEPSQPLFASSENGGIFQYPVLETTVWVFFVAGDIRYPVMFGCSLGTKFFDNVDEVEQKYFIKTDTFTLEIDDKTKTLNIDINNININSKVIDIVGDTTITGTVVINGETTINGNTQMNGTLDVTKNVTSKAVVMGTSDVKTSTVTLNTHKHIRCKGAPTSPAI